MMTPTSPQRPTAALPPIDQEPISFLVVLNLLLRNRYAIFGTAFVFATVVAVTLLLLPRKFTAQSSFMLQTRQSLPGNLSGLASQFGFVLPTGEANESPAFYAELLQSREILSAVVDSPIALHDGMATRQAPLSAWFAVQADRAALLRDKTIKKLENAVGVQVSTKTGVVTLRVTTRIPELSEQISQRMLSWLNEFNLIKRQSQASAERRFTEARLQETLSQLNDAEDRLLRFTQRNRDTRNSPLLRLEEDRLQRDVTMRQQVYTSVMQAYEHSKIEEVRDTPVITILQAPEQPVRPDPRGLVVKVLLVLIIGFVVGIWLAMTREALWPRLAGYASPQEEFYSLLS
ncbi:MAG: hypothetical protein E6J91_03305, partial [Deltaproteobacteria bacterium]